jgi:hypothetical protein
MPHAPASWITRRTIGPPSLMCHRLRWMDPITIWVTWCSRAKLTRAQSDLGPSAQHRVEVHLLQTVSPVVDRLAGDDLKATGQRLGKRPPIALDKPADDVGAPSPPALALGEHGVGLADPRGRAQVDAEMTGRLDLAGGVRVRLRGLAHAFAGALGADALPLLGDLGGLPLRGSPLVGADRLDAVCGFQVTSRPLSILAVPSTV